MASPAATVGGGCPDPDRRARAGGGVAMSQWTQWRRFRMGFRT